MSKQDLELHGLIGGVEGLPSILDWSAYDTNYNWRGNTIATPPNSYNTFLNIVGEGFLMFARGDSTVTVASNPSVRITVDGVAYVFDGPHTVGSSSQGNILVHPIYYKTSLKIEVFNRNDSERALSCDYTYFSKKRKPSRTQTILNANNRKMGYSVNTTINLADVVNISGSGYLLGVEFSGYQISAGGTTIGSITVDSSSVMSSRGLFSSAVEYNKLHNFHGPIRFNSNLRVQHQLNGVGSASIVKVWYILD